MYHLAGEFQWSLNLLLSIQWCELLILWIILTFMDDATLWFISEMFSWMSLEFKVKFYSVPWSRAVGLSNMGRSSRTIKWLWMNWHSVILALPLERTLGAQCCQSSVPYTVLESVALVLNTCFRCSPLWRFVFFYLSITFFEYYFLTFNFAKNFK